MLTMDIGRLDRHFGTVELNFFTIKRKNLLIKCKKSLQTIAFFTSLNIIKLTEPNTPLNDADHVGSFNF